MASIRVLRMPDGRVQIAVPSGVTFEEGKRIIERVQAELGADVPIVYDGPVEAHRHDPETVKVSRTQHAH